MVKMLNPCCKDIIVKARVSSVGQVIQSERQKEKDNIIIPIFLRDQTQGGNLIKSKKLNNLINCHF